MGRTSLNIVEFLMVIFSILIYTVLFSPLYFVLGVDVVWYYLLFTFLLILLGILISNGKIWLKYRGVREVNSELEVQSQLQHLSDELSIEKPRLVVIDSPISNAYAVDYIGFRPIIILTDSLVYTLDSDETKSVISHELSHLASYDSYLMTSLSTIIRFIQSSHNVIRRSFFDDILITILLLVPFIVTRLNLFITRCIFFAISRTREFKADKDAAELTSSSDMMSALVNISEQIGNLEQKQKRKYQGNEDLSIMPINIKNRLFSTHPNTEKRINRLKRLDD